MCIYIYICIYIYLRIHMYVHIHVLNVQIANCSVPCLFLHLPSAVPDECVKMADLVLMTVSFHTESKPYPNP